MNGGCTATISPTISSSFGGRGVLLEGGDDGHVRGGPVDAVAVVERAQQVDIAAGGVVEEQGDAAGGHRTSLRPGRGARQAAGDLIPCASLHPDLTPFPLFTWTVERGDVDEDAGSPSP